MHGLVRKLPQDLRPCPPGCPRAAGAGWNLKDFLNQLKSLPGFTLFMKFSPLTGTSTSAKVWRAMLNRAKAKPVPITGSQ